MADLIQETSSQKCSSTAADQSIIRAKPIPAKRTSIIRANSVGKNIMMYDKLVQALFKITNS